MHLRRILTVMKHAWHHMLHSRETWVDVGWFPVINTLVFGGFATYIASQSGYVSAQLTIINIVLWYAIDVGSYSIAVGALWEVWARSFSSLFISPLTLPEFVAGHILFSSVKQVLILAILTTLCFVIFHVSPLQLGLMLPIYIVLLGLYGNAFGMLIFGLILRFGTGLQSMAWGLIMILQPLIGMYYPVEILPYPIQIFSKLLAPSYIFASIREQVATGSPNWGFVGIAGTLDILSLVFGYLFMKHMWERARRAGTLARMEE